MAQIHQVEEHFGGEEAEDLVGHNTAATFKYLDVGELLVGVGQGHIIRDIKLNPLL
jgi:hypothetical protein